MKADAYIWKRPQNGRYYVVFYEGALGDRRRQESLKTRDLRTAQDRFFIWKQQQLQEIALGIRQVGVPLSEAVDEYMRHFEKRNKAVSVKRYRNALDNVLEFVGRELPLGALQPKDIQDYQLHRVAHADRRTVDYEVDVTRAFANWCKRRKWLRENVADTEHVERLIKKAEKAGDKRIFTDDELKVLLARHEDRYWQLYYVFNTLFYTGLRIGELAHLTVKDVDLRKLELRIREKTLKIPVWNGKKKTIDVREISWTPKSYERREVPIEPRLEPILREFQERRIENIFGLYFLSERGCQVSDHVSRPLKDLTDKQDVSVHLFRHTHISHALNRWGRYPTLVQKWVGHRDLSTTQQYLHVSTEDLHREAKKIG